MRNLLVTDLHKKSALNLIHEQRKISGIERVIIMGDFDSPEIIEELLDLKFPKVILPGNHDYPFMRDALRLSMGKKLDFDKIPDYVPFGPDTYWAKVCRWMNNPKLLEYARSFLEREEETKFQHDELSPFGNITYVHASIFDDENKEKVRNFKTGELEEKEYSYSTNEEFLPFALWARLTYNLEGFIESNIRGNFFEMFDISRNYWLMFRGHDWGQRAFSVLKGDYSLTSFESKDNIKTKRLDISLNPERDYILSCGAFNQGQYVIFDDSELKVEFHNPLIKDSWGE